MSQHVRHLSLVRLPEGGPVRHYTRPHARQTESYRTAYDQRTLIYEAWVADGRLNLICPRLLNLWPVLRQGLEAGGVPLRLRRRRFLRYEWLSTPLPDDPVFRTPQRLVSTGGARPGCPRALCRAQPSDRGVAQQ
ncbi:hypothetical protein [Salibaculum halophilum]|uniref:hypothetical protein n=1 Tax=Salibaculum halophilum TaxID=1914408 RepID=UPI000A11E449|nr:hypothetical protein [Salibaculum halophilum]